MKALFLLTTCICWITLVSSSLTVEDDQRPLRYELVRFTTGGATKKSYMQFIEGLRRPLSSGNTKYEIPLLRGSSTLPSQRFLLVELSNWATKSVTVALDVTDAYLVAYEAESRSFFFPDAPASASSNVFTNTPQAKLPFKSLDIEKIAGVSRADVDLGILELEDSISVLYRTPTVSRKELARAFLVIAHVIAEAARFRYIEQRVRASITNDQEYTSFRPDAGVISLENNWIALASAIQNSNQGVFSKALQLQRSDSGPLTFDSVTRTLIANLALMPLICKDQTLSQLGYPLIRSVVASDEDTCVIPEPTVRISGRNGLCADVKDGTFENRNRIILWGCKPHDNTDPNQLWTLKRDGKIQSNGKYCLTTSAANSGSDVMIDDCSTASSASTKWKISTNGFITNPQSVLDLSAGAGNGGTTVTVETKSYSTSQAWLASNLTNPYVTAVVGLFDLCMTANSSSVWVEECAGGNSQQRWAFYPDGSIRPLEQRDSCLTSNNHFKGTNIIVLSCNPGWASQRWVFRNDGSIFNMYNGYVMDVRRSNPSLKQIILWPVTGNPNQKWYPLV